MATLESPEDEIWKVIPSKPLFEASSYGRIRSIADKKLRNFYLASGKYLKFYPKGSNRLVLEFVHIAVAEAFLGSKPFPHYEVDHIDNNRLNNRSDNLQYVSNCYNCRKDNRYGHFGEPRKKVDQPDDR